MEKGMANTKPSGARRQLDRFCRQYIQVQLNLDFPDGECLRQDVYQEEIYSRLFDENNLPRGPPKRYQLKALKELTERIEDSIQDWEEEGVSDNLMNYLSSLFVSSIPAEAAEAQQKSFVTYTLSSFTPLHTEKISINSPGCNGYTLSRPPEPPTIILHESRNVLSASGTTGNRTWEASLHLSNYLCTNPSLIQGHSILELGAGTGYISILCSKYLGASHVIATDGSDDVLSSLSTNFYLNQLQDSSVIGAREVKWGQALISGEHAQWNAGREIDVVLGADLTYDVRVVPALVATFGDIFDLYPKVKILYAGTVRNPETFEVFLGACKRNQFVAEDIDFEILEAGRQEGPFYDDRVPIRLCRIVRP